MEFVIPNLADKKRLLGLDFMIEPNDSSIDAIEPIYEVILKQPKSTYSEEEFQRLITNASSKIKKIYNTLDNYLLSLSSNIRKNTTSNYVSYTNGKNFV